MRTQHSTISRRDFMKGLGLTGAGIGLTAGAAPVFHDMDELLTSSGTINKRPWWVKEREFKDATTPIDWPSVERRKYFWAYPMTAHQEAILQGIMKPEDLPYEVQRILTHEELEARNKVVIDYCKNEFPGWEPGPDGFGDVRNTALAQVSEFFGFTRFPRRLQTNGTVINLSKLVADAGGGDRIDGFLPPLYEGVKTPEEMGVAKWQGTPEENLMTLRSVARLFGAEDVGCVEVDEDIKKMVFEADMDGKKYVFEDVDEAYETATKRVIPNKCKWVFTWTMRQPPNMTRHQAGRKENAPTYITYMRGHYLSCYIKDFTRGLGYTMVGAGGTGIGCVGATGGFAALSGLGELGRASYIIHPKYGLTNRAMWMHFTDFPIVPTRPIDFGSREFCMTCKICSTACPFGAIKTGDPTWEDDTIYGNPGFLGWRCNYDLCPHCPICQGTCPFNTVRDDKSFIHELVRLSASHTTVFNSFFKQMDLNFDYGRKDQRDWWKEEDFPFGIDTSY